MNIMNEFIHYCRCTGLEIFVSKPRGYPAPAYCYKSSASTSVSSSLCRDITCISEDSSEIMFLLVENYNLTAP